jgi:serine/threonine-protein kinase
MSRALGRYELLRPLARGGMGEVYLARRRAAGVEKWLVVKRMRPERAGDARFLDLFMREAKLTMSLAHQNIVPVFDFGRVDDQVFLAMERVEGKDLGSTLQKAAKPLPPLLAAFIAAECLQALDYAHRRKGPDGTDLGIVHRDVTPRNVLLSWSGEVKLTDFGIAALATDDPSHGKMAGTPAYMAPEQARGEPLDARADVYSVGMVLREAITGVRPRRGADREAHVAAAKTGVLDPWPDGFDSPLRTIVDKATAAAREDRFPDARSMLEELDQLIVTERAAKKGESPARLVAAWLAEVWEGERDEPMTFDGKIDAGEMLSFLDDGALDVVGTGTQRSMLATSAEQTPPVGVPAIVENKKESRPPTQTELSAPPPAALTETRRRGAIWFVVPVVVLAGGAVAYSQLRAKDDGKLERVEVPAPTPPPVPAPTPDPEPKPAPVVVEPTPDQKPTPVAKTPPAQKTIKTHAIVKTTNAGSAATAATPPATVVKHKVMFQTSPQWSWFTVDGGATKFQTLESVELPPGSHTIHFTGNEYFPADKTITIEVVDQDVKKAVKLEAESPP